ncbi:Ubiquitin system component Cue [Trema orientale]|uniref:Ubiquitin system component Cue n=1 Tax=Trema orientale TaxID=63057 RepID=A0A2P5FPV5_TREOI|nr:Ubiquitin system component Cue [Trema orientale]
MSAIVCGKRSIFEELPTTPPVSKRIRFSSSSTSPSSSPVRFSPPKSSSVSALASSNQYPFATASQSSQLVDYLRGIFPDMDPQLLERALEECGDDLDSAIRSLNELRLGSVDQNLGSSAGASDVAAEADVQLQSQVKANGEVPVGEENLPKDGADWVELFVREMMSASDMDDAKARASRVLEVLEKSIYTRASADAAQSLHQENTMLKEQVEALIQENTILKRAVSIQHERHKEFEDRNQELQQLKQLVAQYQEQLRTLEVNNYALTLHLKQAQQSSSIPGRFHPDVF